MPPSQNGSASRELEPTLIDALLADQQRLTAVERFARAHERHEITGAAYRHLLPLTAPASGEQYAFEVDLDQCSGCKACVTACHSLNGLDEGEAWRDVGTLMGEAVVPLPDPRGGNRVVPLEQTVTTACHHCVEPACLLGCPVLAYDKDPATGIVRHLDDQCIGCSYCVLKCPYDVPKYSASRGIVRKCDMCHGRLAVGEAPACVQACPNEAIRITVVKQEWTRVEFRKSAAGTGPANRWLPDAPDPAYTLPTTRYRSAKGAVVLHAADHAVVTPQPAHWPLILMLVLTQAGIGGLVASSWLASMGAEKNAPVLPGLISISVFFAGLLASVFHLGRPAKAWRVWLGWRTSWLSREAIALNLFAGVAATAGVATWPGLNPPMIWCLAIAVAGVIAVFAQTMVYVDTRRESWRLSFTAPRFFGTTLVLGLAAALLIRPGESVAVALLLASLVKLAAELRALQHADSNDESWTPLRRTAFLQLGVLRPALGLRILLVLIGGVFLPFLLAVGAAPSAVPGMVAGLCLLGELVERWLFFTSVAPPRMPGSH